MSFSNWGGPEFFDAAIDTIGYPLTISAWVKKTSAEWDITANYVWVIGNDFSSDDFQVRCYATHDRMTGLRKEDGTNQTTHTGSGIPAGSLDDLWFPVIQVYASATSHIIYVRDTSIAGIENTSDRDLTVLDSFRLGRLMGLIGAHQGKIAEVTLWDKALSDADVNSIESSAETGPAGNTIASANCVGYWPLDHAGSTQVDESGTSNGSMVDPSGDLVYETDHPIITGITEQLSMGGVIITP